MKTAVEHNNIGPSRCLPDKAYGAFSYLSANVGKEKRIQRIGCEFAKLFCKFGQPRVHHRGGLGMNHCRHLLLCCRDNFWMAVSGAGNADSRCKIEIPTTFRVDNIGTFSFGGSNACRLLE